MPQQHLYAALCLVGIFLLTYIGYSSGNMLLLGAMVAVPVGVFLVNHPALWFALVVVLSSSRLRVPGLPDQLALFDAMGLGLVLVLGAMFIIRRHDKDAGHGGATGAMMWMFAAVVVFTMGYRGIGLRALGSHLWGGMVYILVLTSLGLVMLIRLVRVPRTAWLVAFFGMVLLSFLPLAAQLSFHLSHGRMGFVYRFIQPTGFLVESLQSELSGEGIQRFNSGSLVALMAVPLVCFRRPFHGYALIVTVAVAAVTMPMVAFSGSRYSAILLIAFLLCWAAFESRRFNWRMPLVLLTLSGMALLVAGQFAHLFPEPVQRVLTFVPGARVEHVAATDAAATIDWRLELWVRSLENLRDNPQWLLIGQGIAFDPTGLEGLELAGAYSAEWAFVCKAYHQGALSLLMVFGIPGLVLGLGILFGLARRHYLALRREPCEDQWLNRMYRTVLAMFICRAIMFVTVSGGVRGFLPELFFLGALLEGLRMTRRRKPAPAVEKPVFLPPLPTGYAIPR